MWCICTCAYVDIGGICVQKSVCMASNSFEIQQCLSLYHSVFLMCTCQLTFYVQTRHFSKRNI